MRRLIFVSVVLVMIGLLAAPATAQISLDQVYSSISLEEMKQLMTQFGYTFTVSADSQGDPMIAFQQEGYKVGLYFYNKVAGKYTAIQLSAGFSLSQPPSLGSINQWNRAKRYARAYLDQQGDPRVELDLDLEGGATAGAIKELFRTNRVVLTQFVRHIQTVK